MSEILDDSRAKQEIAEAYQKAKASGAIQEGSADALEFGKVCVKWHDWYIEHKTKDKGNRIRYMWKALGIPHTTAYKWMADYRKDSGTNPPVAAYTKEELARMDEKAINENRLAPLFAECGFSCDVRQNSARSEPRFNVVFGALPEPEVVRLAEILKGIK